MSEMWNPLEKVTKFNTFLFEVIKESCQAELGKLSFAKDSEQSRSTHGNVTGKRVSDIRNRFVRLHLPSRTVELW